MTCCIVQLQSDSSDYLQVVVAAVTFAVVPAAQVTTWLVKRRGRDDDEDYKAPRATEGVEASWRALCGLPRARRCILNQLTGFFIRSVVLAIREVGPQRGFFTVEGEPSQPAPRTAEITISVERQATFAVTPRH